MITGNEAVSRALALLGYDADDSGGQPFTRLWDKAPTALQMVYADLYQTEQGTLPSVPENPDAPLSLSARAEEALPIGLAMVLAQMTGGEEDGARLREWYVRKRAGLSGFGKKPDVLPITEGG